MRVSPHLTFNGSCREAFQAYHQIFGGVLSTMLTYGESPMASQVPIELRECILHASLQLEDGAELTGVDVHPNDFVSPRGFFVTLTIDDEAKAKDVYSALSVGGQIRLAYVATFWSPGFGVVVDRFGIPWEINAGGGSSALLSD